MKKLNSLKRQRQQRNWYMSQTDQKNRLLGAELIKKVGGMGQANHILNLVEDEAEYVGFMYMQYKLSSANPDDNALLLHDDIGWRESSYFNHELTNLVERRFICLKDLEQAVAEHSPIYFNAETWIYERKSAYQMVWSRSTHNSTLGVNFTYEPFINTANGTQALRHGDLIISDGQHWAVQCPEAKVV